MNPFHVHTCRMECYCIIIQQPFECARVIIHFARNPATCSIFAIKKGLFTGQGNSSFALLRACPDLQHLEKRLYPNFIVSGWQFNHQPACEKSSLDVSAATVISVFPAEGRVNNLCYVFLLILQCDLPLFNVTEYIRPQ